MTLTEDEVKAIKEELQWLDMNEYRSKRHIEGPLGILPPLGCLVTAGVLARGLFLMYKNDGAGQQRMMRFRVLSQGVTAALAAIGLLHFKAS